MGLYSIETAELKAENFLAGEFPVVTNFGTIKKNAVIRKHAPLVLSEDGIEELTAAMLPTTGENASAGSLDKLIGIAADEPSGEEVTFYLTGEFFAEGLTLPEGVTAEDLKPAFRKLSIFIKEMKNNG
ncbi:MAG: hypothetical protein NC452_05150 [Eubacterium sp.]|nr:hypothetical protein [Eubacterium sp.]